MKWFKLIFLLIINASLLQGCISISEDKEIFKTASMVELDNESIKFKLHSGRTDICITPQQKALLINYISKYFQIHESQKVYVILRESHPQNAVLSAINVAVSFFSYTLVPVYISNKLDIQVLVVKKELVTKRTGSITDRGMMSLIFLPVSPWFPFFENRRKNIEATFAEISDSQESLINLQEVEKFVETRTCSANQDFMENRQYW